MNSSKPDPDKDHSEFAPEYTKQERIKLVAINMAWAIPLVLFSEYWFFDWLEVYAENAHCYQYGTINGVQLVMYGVFVGIPLSIALLLFVFEGRRAITVLKVGQYPLPGQKVLRPTRYKYGNKARAYGALMLFVILFLLAMSVWGCAQAKKLTQEIPPCAKPVSVSL